MEENEIGGVVIGAAISVHQALGPGLLETVYEAALAHELRCRGLEVERQRLVGFVYRGIRFDEGFRLDLCVESRVIVEIKSVECLNNVHRKQLLTYLRLTELRLGYLLNFGESRMKDGIIRTVNGLRG
jgi:GxxExxY protein